MLLKDNTPSVPWIKNGYNSRIRINHSSFQKNAIIAMLLAWCSWTGESSRRKVCAVLPGSVLLTPYQPPQVDRDHSNIGTSIVAPDTLLYTVVRYQKGLI